ncbi:hypothetical protein KOR42_34490 [Thalassoglobus neptunius]|uniref:Uncharacterized protein n=1 Tax=Thalassoglobus neptunius TaxID=1938619 RepID=A0A5C5WPI6_9PLAN|nr:Rrf2 family transcriptional regulator [Thalassoglobus neptunius]TWT51762.1 hypothetical protein KOR42_34490 [Thalassoglobus neptunius]
MNSTILVTPRNVPGMAQGTKTLVKSVIGVRENVPPSGITVWFNDATLTAERLTSIVKRPVIDGTPEGRMRQRKQSRQYVRDVTRQTSRDRARAILRGLLAEYQDHPRVGLITHRPLLSVLNELGPPFQDRVVKSTYFGSGEERSSNAWYQECDLILVLGTPRVPPQAIKDYLVQVDEQEVACAESVWGDVLWQALTTNRETNHDDDDIGRDVAGDEHTETTEVKTFSGRGYHDPRWREAHRDLVRAQLVQAIGRGRTVLEDGCDVVVVSSGECGLTVIDAPVPYLNDAAMQVYREVQQLTMENPNKESLGKTIVSSSEIAQRLDLSTVRVRELLRTLESFSLVQRHGQRGGWSIAAHDCSQRPVISSVQETAHVPCR